MERNTFDHLFAEAILKGVSKVDIHRIDIADCDQHPDADYEDGFGWREATEEEHAVLLGMTAAHLSEIQEAPNWYEFASPNETMDTILGFHTPDGSATHFRIREHSSLQLAKLSGNLTISNIND